MDSDCSASQDFSGARKLDKKAQVPAIADQMTAWDAIANNRKLGYCNRRMEGLD